MPYSKIEILKGHSKEYKATLFRSVHDGLVNAISMTENNCTQRIYELDEEHYERPPGKTEKYTLIELALLPGRSVALKKNLITEITRLLGERLEIAPADIIIIINDHPLENWGFRGTHAIEMDLNYKKDV